MANEKLANRIKQTCSGSGTGDLDILSGAAVSGFKKVEDSYQIGESGIFILESGVDWEIFYGTRTSSSVLARQTIIESTNSNNKLILDPAATHTVFVDLDADGYVYVDSSGIAKPGTAILRGSTVNTFTDLVAVGAGLGAGDAGVTYVMLGNSAQNDGGGGIFRWNGASWDRVYLRKILKISTAAGGDPTPDVSNADVVVTTASTTITNFIGGTLGQLIQVVRGGTNITLANNSGMDLGGTDLQLTPSTPSVQLLRVTEGSLTIWKLVGTGFQPLARTNWIIEDRDLLTPPVSPVNQSSYLLPASGVLTGAWATFTNNYIAIYDVSGWRQVAPIEGMTVDLKDENISLRWDGSAWYFIYEQTKDAVKFANSDATPSVAGQRIFQCADVVPAAITNFLNMEDGRIIIVQPGLQDQVFTHSSSFVFPGATDFTLRTTDGPIQFYKENNVIRMISGGAVVNLDPTNLTFYGAVLDGVTDDTAAWEAAIAALNAGTIHEIRQEGGVSLVSGLGFTPITASRFEIHGINGAKIFKTGANGRLFTFGAITSPSSNGRVHDFEIEFSNTPSNPDADDYVFDYIWGFTSGVFNITAINFPSILRVQRGGILNFHNIEGTFAAGASGWANILLMDVAVIRCETINFSNATTASNGNAEGSFVTLMATPAATGTTLNIASGVVTPTSRSHLIQTEGSASTDDLHTLNAGSYAVNDILSFKPASGNTIVVKHGVGNILLPGGVDITLTSANHNVFLRWDGTNWRFLGKNATNGTVDTVTLTRCGFQSYSNDVPGTADGKPIGMRIIRLGYAGSASVTNIWVLDTYFDHTTLYGVYDEADSTASDSDSRPWWFDNFRLATDEGTGIYLNHNSGSTKVRKNLHFTNGDIIVKTNNPCAHVKGNSFESCGFYNCSFQDRHGNSAVGVYDGTLKDYAVICEANGWSFIGCSIGSDGSPVLTSVTAFRIGIYIPNTVSKCNIVGLYAPDVPIDVYEPYTSATFRSRDIMSRDNLIALDPKRTHSNIYDFDTRAIVNGTETLMGPWVYRGATASTPIAILANQLGGVGRMAAGNGTPNDMANCGAQITFENLFYRSVDGLLKFKATVKFETTVSPVGFIGFTDDTALHMPLELASSTTLVAPAVGRDCVGFIYNNLATNIKFAGCVNGTATTLIDTGVALINEFKVYEVWLDNAGTARAFIDGTEINLGGPSNTLANAVSNVQIFTPYIGGYTISGDENIDIDWTHVIAERVWPT